MFKEKGFIPDTEFQAMYVFKQYMFDYLLFPV